LYIAYLRRSYSIIRRSNAREAPFTTLTGHPKKSQRRFFGDSGYSIGKWIDENGDGRYDTLEVELDAGFARMTLHTLGPAVI
jgi:hypothetical protein